MLTIALQCALSHPILHSDEYFKEFLLAADFGEKIPLIKNVEPPVIVKGEYFGGRWSRIGGGGMARDQSYIRVLKNRPSAIYITEYLGH